MDEITVKDPLINDLQPRSSRFWYLARRGGGSVVEYYRADAATPPGAKTGRAPRGYGLTGAMAALRRLAVVRATALRDAPCPGTCETVTRL